jgi:hypothetical protein
MIESSSTTATIEDEQKQKVRKKNQEVCCRRRRGVGKLAEACCCMRRRDVNQKPRRVLNKRMMGEIEARERFFELKIRCFEWVGPRTFPFSWRIG